ncbi:membrane hypothetical protein [Candidatus Xenohaliotis californiensis]|uniref:IncA protein n=1 Tax=Candidatus Xenohaliotis californiensis TaxID=84677 RepID=A0ABM9N8S8_9RICK|nr:membrane hypothetical protein [Candidatus Xenohaliotis californiensis]
MLKSYKKKLDLDSKTLLSRICTTDSAKNVKIQIDSLLKDLIINNSLIKSTGSNSFIIRSYLFEKSYGKEYEEEYEKEIFDLHILLISLQRLGYLTVSNSYYLNKNENITKNDAIDEYIGYKFSVDSSLADDTDKLKELMYCMTADKKEQEKILDYYNKNIKKNKLTSIITVSVLAVLTALLITILIMAITGASIALGIGAGILAIASIFTGGMIIKNVTEFRKIQQKKMNVIHSGEWTKEVAETMIENYNSPSKTNFLSSTDLLHIPEEKYLDKDGNISISRNILKNKRTLPPSLKKDKNNKYRKRINIVTNKTWRTICQNGHIPKNTDTLLLVLDLLFVSETTALLTKMEYISSFTDDVQIKFKLCFEPSKTDVERLLNILTKLNIAKNIHNSNEEISFVLEENKLNDPKVLKKIAYSMTDDDCEKKFILNQNLENQQHKYFKIKLAITVLIGLLTSGIIAVAVLIPTAITFVAATLIVTALSISLAKVIESKKKYKNLEKEVGHSTQNNDLGIEDQNKQVYSKPYTKNDLISNHLTRSQKATDELNEQENLHNIQAAEEERRKNKKSYIKGLIASSALTTALVGFIVVAALTASIVSFVSIGFFAILSAAVAFKTYGLKKDYKHSNEKLERVQNAGDNLEKTKKFSSTSTEHEITTPKHAVTSALAPMISSTSSQPFASNNHTSSKMH